MIAACGLRLLERFTASCADAHNDALARIGATFDAIIVADDFRVHAG